MLLLEQPKVQCSCRSGRLADHQRSHRDLSRFHRDRLRSCCDFLSHPRFRCFNSGAVTLSLGVGKLNGGLSCYFLFASPPREAAGLRLFHAGSGVLVALLPRLGVCFRMYTEGEAKKIGVVGWVKNTSKGTVTSQVQGPEEKVNSMKSWLSKVGSPSSRIDRTNFSNEKSISKLEYSNFSIRY
nr:acylphosphatase-2 [Cavia porcellus]